MTQRPQACTAMSRPIWDGLITLGGSDGISLQMQIRRALVAAILDGTLPAGIKLPSSRVLAGTLGIARNTVSAAYRQLADDGLVGARPRSGYVVLQGAAGSRIGAKASRPEPTTPPSWLRRIGTQYSALRQISKPPDWYNYPFQFIYGQPDPALFPTTEWRACSRAALAVLAIRDWSSDMIDGDDAALIGELQRRILPQRGIFAAPDEIMITVGSQHALYMLAELLASAASTVGIEEPGYPDARNIFALRGARLRTLPIGDAGFPVSRLAGCDLAYLTPSHQCPTASTISLADRTRLLRQADVSDVVIIEDDYESELTFSGQQMPALKSLDRSGRVIYLGSLSKTLAPGLRIGYMVGARALIAQARILRRLMLRHPPANNQRATALFLSLGHHDRLLHRLKSNLTDRAATLAAALNSFAPELAFEPPLGGSSLWVRGPEGLDSAALAIEAARHGVLIEAGAPFFHEPHAACRFFRLGYSSIPKERIADGIRQLAVLLPGRNRIAPRQAAWPLRHEGRPGLSGSRQGLL